MSISFCKKQLNAFNLAVLYLLQSILKQKNLLICSYKTGSFKRLSLNSHFQLCSRTYLSTFISFTVTKCLRIYLPTEKILGCVTSNQHFFMVGLKYLIDAFVLYYVFFLNRKPAQQCTCSVCCIPNKIYDLSLKY